MFGWAALLPLACAGCMTAYAMLTRRIAGKDHALTSLFYPTLAGAIVVPIFYPLAMVFAREPFHMAHFVALGAMGAIGHWFLIGTLTVAARKPLLVLRRGKPSAP